MVDKKKHNFSKISFLGLIDNLESLVKKLHWKPSGTEWSDYYNDTNYSSNSFCHKKDLVDKFITAVNPITLWDLGANTGMFTRIASAKNIPTVSFDVDPAAIEKNYLKVKNDNEKNILPLVLDLTNPSPPIGWGNSERMTIVERGPAHMVLVLALLHHLAISNNLPFAKIGSFLKKISKYLVIEFIPKSDSQVQRLLQTREDIFYDYNVKSFEEVFSRYFTIIESVKIQDSDRTMYLMRNGDFDE
jgi:hypothetical protein